MRCQNRWLQATDFVSHRKITLFRWRALKNPGWIYSASLADGIDVLRVLHSSMDIEARFDPGP
jgi:plasmid stabilization system protein ParE